MKMNYKNDFVYITGCDLYFMDITEKLVISLLNTSNRKIIVYGINCEVPFEYPNLIKKTLYVETKSKHDKWFWKQQSCVESLKEGYDNYVWVDGDILCNNNVDDISQYFSDIDNYPLATIHVRENLGAWFSDGTIDQLFNSKISEKYNVPRKILPRFLHVSFFIFNSKCEWFFQEILDLYDEIESAGEYIDLLPWQDESVHNFLQCKYGFKKHLPRVHLSLLNAPEELNIFYGYWNDTSPNTFENEKNPFGSCYVPEDKNQILVFHENKNLEIADEIIQFIKLQKNGFYNSKYFFVNKNKIMKYENMLPEPINYHPKPKFKVEQANTYQFTKFEFENLNYIKPGDVVVDIGAGFGYFERYCYLKKASTIYCFESDKDKFDLLKLNCSPISIIENLNVDIGNIFDQNNVDFVDFLKIDDEGNEFKLLNVNFSKIDRISIKYYHYHYDYNDKLLQDFITGVMKHGYNSWNYMDDDVSYIHFYKN